MNDVDKKYLSLLKDIVDNGAERDSRAGKVRSVFGRQVRFDLKEGLPLLTTKKVFTKGIIHELLWFLKGDTNIKYLVDNGVNIWNDDAYRYYCTLVNEHNKMTKKFPYSSPDEIEIVSKEQFIENVKNEVSLFYLTEAVFLSSSPWPLHKYVFGDLGPVYGKQWRSFGYNKKDQINEIIEKLKTNPSDRRMLCVAYNPDMIDNMALPPCHVMFQFYTKELSHNERMRIFNERYMKGEIPQKFHDWLKEQCKNTEDGFDIKMPDDGSDFDIADIPKYKLSCMFNMRSNDFCCGAPFNWSQYAMLTHVIANIVNMVPDELVYTVGDCHIYLNHMDGIKEQLSRNGSDVVPKLIIHGKHSCVEDFNFEDFEIVDYHPDPPIKFPLNVG